MPIGLMPKLVTTSASATLASSGVYRLAFDTVDILPSRITLISPSDDTLSLSAIMPSRYICMSLLPSAFIISPRRDASTSGRCMFSSKETDILVATVVSHSYMGMNVSLKRLRSASLSALLLSTGKSNGASKSP